MPRNVAMIIVRIVVISQIRKVNLILVYIVVEWIFFFNKYMIQNPVFFGYNFIMLSIVYTIVLWANFDVKLLMSSASE